MSRYRVINTYQYTETVEVEASNSKEAILQAYGMDGERNCDDVHIESRAEIVETTYRQTRNETTK